MGKRHINEMLKTSFANSGRAKGAGILEDNYGDESRSDHTYQRQPMFEPRRGGEDGEVVIIRGGKT